MDILKHLTSCVNVANSGFDDEAHSYFQSFQQYDEIGTKSSSRFQNGPMKTELHYGEDLLWITLAVDVVF